MISSKIESIVTQLLYKNAAPVYMTGEKGSANLQADEVPVWMVYFPATIDKFRFPYSQERTFPILLFFLVVSDIDREPSYYDAICDDMVKKQETFLAAFDQIKDSEGRRMIEIIGDVNTFHRHQSNFFDVPVTGLEFTFSAKLFNYQGVCVDLPETPEGGEGESE